MAGKKTLLTAVAGLTAGAVALRRLTARSPGPDGTHRWLVVTVQRAPDDVRPHEIEPLKEFGDRIETRIGAAPGDRGTELAARFRDPAAEGSGSVAARVAGNDPRQDLRRALREAKALLEAGEVLLPDAPPTGHESPGGKLIGTLSRRAGGEGVL
ncbi:MULTISPECIES: hypothetical protein [unclassified Streptomyces]|uniref:hypothetical protein n=1 Tax=unclassified Streptomyces TaxID=2593676 RepID=UPI0036861B52